MTLDQAALGERVVRVCAVLTDAERLRAESIDFHFHALAQGTPADAASLVLECRPLRAQCSDCGTVFNMDDTVTLCPYCENGRSVRLEGPSIRVSEVTVETSGGPLPSTPDRPAAIPAS